jgi:hypothetical protein
MKRHSVSRQLRGRQCLVAIAVATIFLALQPPSAFASGDLSSIILSKTLPGFVASPAVTDNGPLTSTSINALFATLSAAQRAEMTQAVSSGQISGYVRIWRSQPLEGDGFIELAFQSQSQYNVSTLLGGFEKGAAAEIATGRGSMFDVPGITDANGYNLDLTNDVPPVREFIVAFAKGNTDYLMTLVTSKYDLTAANATTLAQRQWAQAPGSSVAPQTPPSVGEDLLWGVIAALIVAMVGILWQRARTRRAVRDNPALDVTRYATYKHIPKDQRKAVRKSLVKSRLNADTHLNEAALAWANHNLTIYWITLASFVALDATVVIVSQGHVYLVSLLAIGMFLGALNLTRKKNRFIDLQKKYAELVALNAQSSNEPASTLD